MAKTSRRNGQVVRTWTVLHLVGERARTLDELALDLGVTTRTIRRDLEALQEAGFPLYDETGGDSRVRWRLVPGQSAPPRRDVQLQLRFSDVPAVLTLIE